MRVDFYQLSRDPVEVALPLIARQVMKAGERLLVVSADEELLGRIGSSLWAFSAESFLANGHQGEGYEDRQPILLSSRPEPANGAKFISIVDGQWRDECLAFERTFFFFNGSTIEDARRVWSRLRSQQGAERHFWKQEGGRWTEIG